MSLRGAGLWRALGVAGLALALDQVTKALIRGEIAPGERVEVALGLDLVHVTNEGIAFGLLEGIGAGVLVIGAAAFLVLLGYFLAAGDRPGLWAPVGLLAGGALGNLVDRVREGAVTDFLDIGAWPAFNVADVEITIGVVVLLVMFLREGDAAGAGDGGGSGEGSGAGRA